MQSYKKIIITPSALALIAALGFSLAGILGVWLFVDDAVSSLPLIIFYFVLVINTYFSVKLFSSLIPPGDRIQFLIDSILIVLYLALAVSLRNIVAFEYAALLLFIAAAAKYAFLLNIVGHPKLLKRKILIDLLGVAGSAATVGGALFWNAFMSAWIFTGLFILANVFFLILRPMYRSDR